MDYGIPGSDNDLPHVSGHGITNVELLSITIHIVYWTKLSEKEIKLHIWSLEKYSWKRMRNILFRRSCVKPKSSLDSSRQENTLARIGIQFLTNPRHLYRVYYCLLALTTAPHDPLTRDC